ncbi:hypothetical protein MMC11_008531 [Xylographa trunciseda]|nr:hypothetical protein [Xylographa trunciseda]
MLRLPTTKIDLGPRDLAWHIDRYHQRKARYDEIRYVSGSLGSTRQASQLQPPKVRLPYLSNHPAYVQQATGHVVADDSLISSEPVPRDSRSFWNGVLAVAGTSMQNTEPLPHELFSDVEAATTSSESHHNSISSDPSSGHDELEVSQQGHESGRNTRDLRDVVEAATQLAEIRSQFSPDSSQSSENGKEDATNSFFDLEAGRGATSNRRRPFFSFRRAGHDGGIDEDISNLSRSFSSQLDFDGSSELMPNYDEQEEEEEEEDLAVAKAVPINGPLPRPVLLHTTSRLRGQGSQMENEDSELAETIASLHELIDGAASPAPRLPTHIEHMRSRSGTIARSPLYFSQAVTSSSPEKPSNVSPFHADLHAGSMTSLLSLPPRRPKQYKPQRESSISSRASHASSIFRGSAGTARHSYQSSHPQWDETDDMRSGASDGDGRSNPPPFPPTRIRDSPAHSFTSSPPQPSPYSATTTRRTEPPPINPLSTSLIYPSHPPTNSPTLPPLPPPFSSTRRLVSFNLALPSSSPTNPFTSPAHPSPPQPHSTHLRNPFHAPSPHTHQPSPASRSPARTIPLHYTPSPSPPPPTTPHRSMRIYNDALPALSQPRTPLGLPRHGVYAGVGAYTAPVQGSRGRTDQGQGNTGASTRAVAGHRASPWHTTPTRTSWLRRAREREEQENVGVYVEAERRLRVRAEERERERELGARGEWDGGEEGDGGEEEGV